MDLVLPPVAKPWQCALRSSRCFIFLCLHQPGSPWGLAPVRVQTFLKIILCKPGASGRLGTSWALTQQGTRWDSEPVCLCPLIPLSSSPRATTAL